MITKYNILPLPVLSAIVSRFDPNLDELRFGHSIVNIMISSDTVTAYSDGSWVMEAVHVSGADVIIRVSKNLEVSVEEYCSHCGNTREW
jgi:hypothetical protein